MTNRPHRVFATFVIVIVAILSASAQERSEKTLLLRSVSAPAEHTSISQRLLMLFGRAGIYGGIAMVNEDFQEPLEEFPQFEGSFEQALEGFAASGHNLKWLELSGGLVVYDTEVLPPLLTVSVRRFQFSRKQPLTRSSDDLLDAPEVNEKRRSLRLVEYGPNLGFAQPKQPEAAEDLVTLSNATVLRVLNSIAGNRAVWLYKESRCETNIVSLSWPVR